MVFKLGFVFEITKSSFIFDFDKYLFFITVVKIKMLFHAGKLRQMVEILM